MKSNATIADTYDKLRAKIPLEITINHMLAVRHSLLHPDDPIIFNIERVTTGSSAFYAWYPVDEGTCKKVLDILYATLMEPSQHENHSTIVECLVGILLVTSKMDIAKEVARTLLTECFGTYKLGTMKRVIRPIDQCERAPLEIDCYLLPQKLSTYSWLGR